MDCLGTYKLTKEALILGLENGIKLIDTATAYNNYEMIDQALIIYSNSVFSKSSKELNLHGQSMFSKRLSVNIIVKLSQDNYINIDRELKDSFYNVITKLGALSAIYMIHAPYPNIPMIAVLDKLNWICQSLTTDTQHPQWAVSNFEIEHLEFIIERGFKPIINQVEYHPAFQRRELLEYCKTNGIQLQAYRPLNQGSALQLPNIQELAIKYKTSAANIIYSWLTQEGITIVCKVSTQQHQEDFINTKRIILDNEDIEIIRSLNKNERTCVKGGWFLPFTDDIKKKWEEK